VDVKADEMFTKRIFDAKVINNDLEIAKKTVIKLVRVYVNQLAKA
jgi:hypothetical protein